MARCAPMLRKFGVCSANCASRRRGWRVAPAIELESIRASAICASRRRGWRVAPVSQKDVSGRLCPWRVAQLHMARRAPS
ncbi:hypothetical protein A2U01_0082038, partial [Trifolium medium]|nr:hypothetical protein [Trifolium medium]